MSTESLPASEGLFCSWSCTLTPMQAKILHEIVPFWRWMIFIYWFIIIYCIFCLFLFCMLSTNFAISHCASSAVLWRLQACATSTYFHLLASSFTPKFPPQVCRCLDRPIEVASTTTGWNPYWFPSPWTWPVVFVWPHKQVGLTAPGSGLGLCSGDFTLVQMWFFKNKVHGNNGIFFLKPQGWSICLCSCLN